MASRGRVIIEADLQTDKFDTKIEKLEDKAEKTARDLENSVGKKQLYEEQFDAAIKKAKGLEDALAKSQDKLATLQDRLNLLARTPVVNTDVIQAGDRTKSAIETEQMEIRRITDLLNAEGIKQEAIGQKIREQEAAIKNKEAALEQVNGELSKIKKQQDAIKQKTAGIDLKNIQSSIKSVGNEVSKVTGKVVRWGLAIFGIRSAYMMVRQAIGTLSQYDKQLATDVEYIRFALASTLKPLIESIIQLVYKLLYYVGYIAKAWFNIDLFANSSASAFKKAKDSLSGANKQAKELKKQLAGFDEMNILSDNASSDSGGSGISTPSFDLDNFKGEVPGWLQWIADHGPEIIAILTGIAAGLLALKLGFTPLQSLGIGIAVAGIVYAIQSLIAYLKDPSLQNFGKIITGIGIAIAGVAIALGAWPVALAGAIVALVGIIISNWDKIKAFLQGGIDWLVSKSEWIYNIFGEHFGAIYNLIIGVFQDILDWLDSFVTNLKLIFDGLIKIVKGIIKGDWKMVWEGAKDVIVGLFTFIVDTITAVFDMMVKLAGAAWELIAGIITAILHLIEEIIGSIIIILKGIFNFIIEIFTKAGQWLYKNFIQPVGNFFSNMWGSVKKGASDAWAGIKTAFKNVATWFKQNVIDKIIGKMRDIGTKVGNAVGGAFKAVINGVLSLVENILNSPIRTINTLIDVINKLLKVNIGYLPTFSLPRLAKGAIASYPGRGTPTLGGNALWGEAGQEAYLPLTDSQFLEQLGSVIGKHVTINATIPVYAYNRQVDRQMKRIQAEEDFANNR